MQPFTLHDWLALTQQHFEQCPAWAKYCCPDDIDEIVSWGLDRQAVNERFAEVGYSDGVAFPVLRTVPLPDFQFLFLVARITAADGTEFAGYILGQHPYVLAVFHDGEEYGFNTNLRDLGEAETSRLRRDSQFKLSPFMPLRYVTPFLRDDGQRIEGVFDYGLDGESSRAPSTGDS